MSRALPPAGGPRSIPYAIEPDSRHSPARREGSESGVGTTGGRDIEQLSVGSRAKENTQFAAREPERACGLPACRCRVVEICYMKNSHLVKATKVYLSESDERVKATNEGRTRYTAYTYGKVPTRTHASSRATPKAMKSSELYAGVARRDRCSRPGVCSVYQAD